MASKYRASKGGPATWARQKPASVGGRRQRSKNCFEKHIVGRVNRKLVDYWATCSKPDCKFLKKASIRASEMPKEQYQVLVFACFFIIF